MKTVRRSAACFLAAVLLLAVLCPFAPAAGLFSARAAALPAPLVLSLGNDLTDADHSYRFFLSSPDILAYETYRRETYETVARSYTDEQIAHSNQSWLLYPAVLLCEATFPDGTVCTVKAFPPAEGPVALSLFGDVLPALSAGGCYTPDAFTITLRFVAAAEMHGIYTVLSDAASAGTLSCPATVHVDYTLPAGADNGGNPSFLFAPLEETLALAYPTLRGHTFAGWETADGNYVDSVPAGTRTLSLTAHFTPRVYKINYVLTTLPGYVFHRVQNGHNPKTYTYGAETPLYPVDPPYGYAFGGWYRTADFTGDEVTAVGPEEVGDVLLYARWFSEAAGQETDLRKAGWGDLDNDGDVTAADARIALRSAVGLEKLSPELIARADFARLGRLTATNARILLRVSVGLDSITDILKEHGLI